MTKTNRVLAIVPARGGSQRVAAKNIARVAGRPALAYTLDHIRESTLIDRAVVSTEDRRIALEAAELGADVIDRPADLATADARLDHVLRHAVDVVSRRDQWMPDVVVMLYGAVPIRPKGFIDQCIQLLADTGADSVRSVEPAVERHPLWTVKLDDAMRIEEYLGKMNYYRRQDLPPVYYYTGACVAIRSSVLMRSSDPDDHFAYFGVDRRACVHEPHACVEIHEPADIAWAEFLLSRRDGNIK